MFSNSEIKVVAYDSNWRKSYITKEFETQTDTYKIVHRGLNVKRSQSKESQTDSYLFVEEDLQADVDEVDLIDFINRVSPKIVNALIDNEKSTAFISYKSAVEEGNTNTCTHTFHNKRDSNDVTHVSQLSWNCTGSVLAASFGDITHAKWCIHTNTGVGLFSLGSRTQLEEHPRTLLETTTCACCVKFHNTLPSVLAAGTHNGELIIWDRSRIESEVLLASSTDNKVHEDSINDLYWANDSTSKSLASHYRLITLGMDGTIVLWNLAMRKYVLTPLNCYGLTARDLPKSVRYKGNALKNLCILCGALNPFDSEYIVTGTNNGAMFICRIRNKEELSLANQNDLKSPVDSILATLSGAVHAICWSKTNRNLIAAVSVDGLIHVYNSEQREQILTIDPGQGYLYDLSLSSLMHGVVATAGESGTVVVSDILAQNIVQNDDNSNLELNSEMWSGKIVLKIQDTDSAQLLTPTNCVLLNEMNYGQLAATDLNGTVYVWQIGQCNTDKGSRGRQIQLEEILASGSNK